MPPDASSPATSAPEIGADAAEVAEREHGEAADDQELLRRERRELVGEQRAADAGEGARRSRTRRAWPRATSTPLAAAARSLLRTASQRSPVGLRRRLATPSAHTASDHEHEHPELGPEVVAAVAEEPEVEAEQVRARARRRAR